ncbi:MAG TPA: 4-hydroxy-3-methylbut-2-enyl diphosphate reductase [Chloroflexota bacterium]|jgi:4-hydroxy-3-methylbut-2-enyl diphosphate reductase|nr:4-hydroxy-3-methylbut-2-enyl diphosphate reductase [Chloroflexota bacterium]
MAVERVIVAAPRGFCAGVTRAVDIVEKALERWGAPVYVRHEIVHNKRVVSELRAKGAIFVDELDEVPSDRPLVFSAHGIAPGVRQSAASRALRTVDATCPLVTKVHSEAKRFARQDYELVYIGHEGHDEAIGTMGEAPERMHLVQTAADVDELEFAPGAKVAFLTQTTLGVDETSGIIDALQRKFPDIASPGKEDICYAATNRQLAVKLMAPKCDLLLVVGSQNSSNAHRLVEASRAAGTAAHLVDGAQDVEPAWLEGAKIVGVTGSASTAEGAVQELIAHLEPQQVEEFRAVAEDVFFNLPAELRA